MQNLGDIRGIDGTSCPAVDVITGGSPCQDLSIAGSRAGLSGERSGLFAEQLRIVTEMRAATNGRFPRYMVWENVPGALNSNSGRDFLEVLNGCVRIAKSNIIPVSMPEDGKWPKSGTLYDEMGRWSLAWRIHDAQYWGVPQRRRRIALVVDFRGQSAPEILFEPQGLPRGSSPTRTQKEPGARACPGNPETTVSAINADAHESGISILQDRVHTLRACLREAVFSGQLREDIVCPTLTRDNERSVGNHTVLCIGNGQANQGISGKAGTLNTTYGQQAICSREAIRRLTPLECERLQGYPDGWTNIGAWIDSRGRPREASDALRYRALGNSLALPFWRWLMRRLYDQLVTDSHIPTLGSLFDGIGGFPYVWPGNTVWTSEIDDFCNAVTHYQRECIA